MEQCSKVYISKFSYFWIIAAQPNSGFPCILVSVEPQGPEVQPKVLGDDLCDTWLQCLACTSVKTRLFFVLQLRGMVLLGRKEAPNPTKLHGCLDAAAHSMLVATTF